MAGANEHAIDPQDPLWAMLERTRPAVIDPGAHAAALTTALVDAGLDPTVTVGRQFDRAMAALYTWDLWAAAYVVLGGCSDDGFEYLRAWIVGRGPEAVAHAVDDPEGYVAHLLDGTDRDAARVRERLGDLAGLDGEALLYAVGQAHEQLAGEWGPVAEHPAPAEPAGEPWDEDDLDGRVPRLLASLPAGWDGDLGGGSDNVGEAGPGGSGRSLGELVHDARSGDPVYDTAQRIDQGLAAFEAGDHDGALALLEPVVEDPERWAYMPAMGPDQVQVAYVVGILRLGNGDLDGSAAVLRLVADGSRTDASVRRALAQIELARGDLAAAEPMIDPSKRAALIDQALVVTLRFRQGRHDEARRLAAGLVHAKPRKQERGEHPWDVAGALVQAALVLAELGDVTTTLQAAERILGLIRDAPIDLPLRWQWCLVLASARRQEGNLDEASDVLLEASDHIAVDTCERGLLECELARLARALGDEPAAASAYERSLASFEAAGEQWHAAQVRAER